MSKEHDGMSRAGSRILESVRNARSALQADRDPAALAARIEEAIGALVFNDDKRTAKRILREVAAALRPPEENTQC